MASLPSYMFSGNPVDLDWAAAHPITGLIHFAADIAQMGPVEVFRASGASSAAVITPEVLRQIAATYNDSTDVAPVPLVLGIPAVDDPAYGWVAYLEVNGPVLYAYFNSVFSEVEKAVRNRQHSKTTVEFIGPASAANPHPGQWSLRNVTIFGLGDLKLPKLVPASSAPASAPAILKPVQPEASSLGQPSETAILDGLALPAGFHADPDQVQLFNRTRQIQSEKLATLAEAAAVAAKSQHPSL